ncbi:hypothetical protein Chor_005804, partial [Crotalus horridus]
FVQACTMLASSVMYFAKMEDYVLPMVFALLLGWVNMLYYTRGLQQTGIYVAIFKDLLHFLMVYVIFLLGFALALVILTGDASHPARNESLPLSDDSKDQAVYAGLLQTALELFRFTIGMGDLEYNEKLKHSDVAMLLVLLFVILTYILLLNMLIALMSETVTNVSGYSQSVWQLQFNWKDWDEKISVISEEPVENTFLEKSAVLKIRKWMIQVLNRSSTLEEVKEEEVPLRNI